MSSTKTRHDSDPLLPPLHNAALRAIRLLIGFLKAREDLQGFVSVKALEGLEEAVRDEIAELEDGEET